MIKFKTKKVMKNKIKLILLVLVGIVITEQAVGQKKIEHTDVKTTSPVFSYIYEGEEGDGAVELQIHDRKYQFVGIGYDRLYDKAKENDPKNPLIKLISMPEVDPLAFRQVESLEEAKRAVDGVNVIVIRYSSLKEAARKLYP